MKVLVAEDDAPMRKLLATQLSWWGYEPIEAADGSKALALLEEHDPPIVISDWMMPELDGVTLVRALREREAAGYVYTILLTAKTEMDDLVEAMEAGADDFLT